MIFVCAGATCGDNYFYYLILTGKIKISPKFNLPTATADPVILQRWFDWFKQHQSDIIKTTRICALPSEGSSKGQKQQCTSPYSGSFPNSK